MNEAFLTKKKVLHGKQKLLLFLISNQKSPKKLKDFDEILQICSVNILYVLATTG